MTNPLTTLPHEKSQVAGEKLDTGPMKYKPLFGARMEIYESTSRCIILVKEFCREFICLVFTLALLPLLIFFALFGITPDENNFSGVIFSLILKNWFSLCLYFGLVLAFAIYVLSNIFKAIAWAVQLF